MTLAFPKSSRPADKRDKRRAKEAEWQRVRRLVMTRDGHRCRACSKRDQVEVHHIRFRSVGGTHTTANCACLCAVCHADIHGYRLTIAGNADGKLKIERS